MGVGGVELGPSPLQAATKAAAAWGQVNAGRLACGAARLNIVVF